MYMEMISLTYFPGFSVKFFFQPFISIMQINHILITHLNILLWYHCTKISQIGLRWSSFKVVFDSLPSIQNGSCTENINCFNDLLLIYYKSKCAKILTAATCPHVVQHTRAVRKVRGQVPIFLKKKQRVFQFF
jgi:hypothetical protein